MDLSALRRRGVDDHRIAVDLPVAWLGELLGETDARVRQPGHVELRLSVQPDGVVIARGALVAVFEVPCGRCLEPAIVDAGARIFATFVRSDPTEGAPLTRDPDVDEGDEGVALSADDLDVWIYDGEHLDLAAVVGEQVKIGYPMRALCSHGEACRGLCPSCGAALNDQPPGYRCTACSGELTGPAVGSADPAEAPVREGPLADALKKLRLPD